jgi:hypothetical protein
MASTQESLTPPAPVPWWRKWLPTARATNRKALDASTRPPSAVDNPATHANQQDAGPRMALVEWIFRF